MSYAEMSMPDLMEAGYRAHATITELQRVYAGPGPVSDAKLARRLLERAHANLAQIVSEMRARGLPIEDPPTVDDLKAEARRDEHVR
jgi:hypothetical protein